MERGMFDITIVGKVENKRYIKKYVRDILTHFFKDRIQRDVPITIKFCNYLDGDYGQCIGTRQYALIEVAQKVQGKRKRKRTQKFDQVLETIAHELIHAKQFLRGEINQRNLIWRGKSDRNRPYDCKKLSYRKTPWEKEAFSQEKRLKITYWDKQYKQLIK